MSWKIRMHLSASKGFHRSFTSASSSIVKEKPYKLLYNGTASVGYFTRRPQIVLSQRCVSRETCSIKRNNICQRYRQKVKAKRWATKACACLWAEHLRSTRSTECNYRAAQTAASENPRWENSIDMCRCDAFVCPDDEWACLYVGLQWWWSSRSSDAWDRRRISSWSMYCSRKHHNSLCWGFIHSGLDAIRSSLHHWLLSKQLRRTRSVWTSTSDIWTDHASFRSTYQKYRVWSRLLSLVDRERYADDPLSAFAVMTIL